MDARLDRAMAKEMGTPNANRTAKVPNSESIENQSTMITPVLIKMLPEACTGLVQGGLAQGCYIRDCSGFSSAAEDVHNAQYAVEKDQGACCRNSQIDVPHRNTQCWGNLPHCQYFQE